MNDDWLEEAAEEASKRYLEKQRMKRERSSPGSSHVVPVSVPSRPREAAEASSVFAAVAAGIIPVSGSGPKLPAGSVGVKLSAGGYILPGGGTIGTASPVTKNRLITVEQAIEAIIAHVRHMPDPLAPPEQREDQLRAAAGDALTKFNHAIRDLLDAEDDDE